MRVQGKGGNMNAKEMLKNRKLTDAVLAGLLIILAVVFLLTAGNSMFGKSGRIYSADMDKIMGEHPALQEAMVKFQEELKSMQGRLDKLEGEAKLKEQQKMQQQIQQIAMTMQNDAVERIMDDVRSIAKRKGYAYIVDKKSLIVGGKDVTEEILSALKDKEEKPEDKLDVSEMPMIPLK